VNAEGKFVDIRTLATEVEDTNLRVGYTTVESRLGIRLKKSVGFFKSKTISQVKRRALEAILTPCCPRVRSLRTLVRGLVLTLFLQ
jgi:hypothetical protein